MLVRITEDNISLYDAQLCTLFKEHGHEYHINWRNENYIYVINDVVVAFAFIANAIVIQDKKYKYINKKKYEIKTKNYTKFCNDFVSTPLDCLYNLIRLPNEGYKGCGIAFIAQILAIKKVIHLATTEPRLYQYYKNAGFKETDFFDMDTNNIYRKVLCWKQND
jgi:hypothetical protein